MIQHLFHWIRNRLLNFGKPFWHLDVQHFVVDGLTEDELRGLAQSQFGKRAWSLPLEKLIEWYNLGV